jgi:hypothetical protein
LDKNIGEFQVNTYCLSMSLPTNTEFN